MLVETNTATGVHSESLIYSFIDLSKLQIIIISIMLAESNNFIENSFYPHFEMQSEVIFFLP